MSIHWTDDERELVIEAMAEQVRKAPRTRFAQLWEAGNDILAPDRRRKWYSAYGSAQTNPNVGGLFVEARKRAATQSQSFESHVDQERAHIPLQQEPEVTWVPVPTPQTLSEVPLKELLAEVIGRILEQYAPHAAETRSEIVERVAKEQGWPVTRIKPTANEPGDFKGIPVPRAVRIALCGPMADQFRRVKERINARKVELVWVDNQKTVDEQDWKRSLDYAIVTRFMRHAHSESANKIVGRERVHWVSQGTDAIVAKVCELVPGASN